MQRSILFLSLLIFSGCAGLFKPTKLYPGEELPETEVVKITAGISTGWRTFDTMADHKKSWGEPYDRYMMSVDDSAINKEPVRLTNESYTLLPGKIEATFHLDLVRQYCRATSSHMSQYGSKEYEYDCNDTLRSRSFCTVRFTAKKGSAYYLDMGKPEGKESMSIWLTNNLTGEKAHYEGGCKEISRKEFPKPKGLLGGILGL